MEILKMKHELLNMYSTIYAAGGGGLNSLWDTIKSDWLGPIYFAAIACFALVFIKDRAWMKLLTFIGVAAIVGVLIFMGEDFFGNNGQLTKAADKQGKNINTIALMAQYAQYHLPFIK